MPRLERMLRRFRRKEHAEPTDVSNGPPKQSVAITNHPIGLRVLKDGIDPCLDIVAIHGLNGHREDTWTHKPSGKLWLKDFLPDVLPHARIFSWGYDANTHSTTVTSKQYINDHSTSLLGDLSLYRAADETSRRPIIFIAHSLGGLVLKNALIISNSARSDHNVGDRAFKISTHGIIFFGTPHQGGENVKIGEILLRIASVFVDTNAKAVKSLSPDSEFLSTQISQFAPISGDFDTKFAYEVYDTSVRGVNIRVVPPESAVLRGQKNTKSIAIHNNHVNMAKFGDPDDNDYTVVSTYLKLMAREASAKIAENWLKEDGQLTVPTQLESRSGSSSPSSEYFEPVRECMQWLGWQELRSTRVLPPSPHRGTLSWLQSHNNVKQWLAGKGQPLCVRGKAGCGKSTLLKSLHGILTRQGDQKQSEPLGLCLFVHSRITNRESVDMLDRFLRYCIAEILRIRPNLFPCIEAPFRESDASESALTDVFASMLEICLSSQSVYILVDAIDQYGDRTRALVNCLRRFNDLAEGSGHTLFFCAAGRITQRTLPLFRRFSTIYLDNENSQDIAIYARSKLKDTYALKQPSIADEFNAYLTKTAKGSFTWIKLVVEAYLDGVDASEPSQALHKKLLLLPKELQEIYQLQLGLVERSDLEAGFRLFSCVAAAVRPLILSELRHAFLLSVRWPPATLKEASESSDFPIRDEDIEAKVVSCCGGLLEVHRPTNTIRFAHHTVVEFLKEAVKPLEKEYILHSHSFDIDTCQRRMLGACESLLRFPELRDIGIKFGGEAAYWKSGSHGDIREYNALSFLPYAAANWMQHHQQSNFRKGCSIWESWNLTGMLHDTQHYGCRDLKTWNRLYCAMFRPGVPVVDHCDTVITFAAYYGLADYIDSRMPRETEDGSDLDMSVFLPAIHAAILSGQSGCLQDLLLKGVPVRSTTPDPRWPSRTIRHNLRFTNTLSISITFARDEMTKRLLEKDGRPDTPAKLDGVEIGAPFLYQLGNEPPELEFIYGRFGGFYHTKATAEEEHRKAAIADIEESIQFEMDQYLHDDMWGCNTVETNPPPFLGDPIGLGLFLDVEDKGQVAEKVGRRSWESETTLRPLADWTIANYYSVAEAQTLVRSVEERKAVTDARNADFA